MSEQEVIIQNLLARVETLESFVLRVDFKKRSKNLKELYANILEAFNEFSGVNITRKERTKENVRTRQMYFKYMRIHTGLSLVEIVKTLDLDYDHSTVSYHLGEFDNLVAVDKEYRMVWIRLNEFVKNKIKNKE